MEYDLFFDLDISPGNGILMSQEPQDASMISDDECVAGAVARLIPSAASSGNSRGRGGNAPSPGPGSQTAPKPGSDEGSGAGKKLNIYGNKQCRGCSKWLHLSDYPSNSAFCWDDKRVFDNIYKMCKTEEERDFLSTARAAHKTASKMLPVGMICPSCGNRHANKVKNNTFCHSCVNYSRTTVKASKKDPSKLDVSITWID